MTKEAAVHKIPADFRKAIDSDAKVKDAWADITPLARNEWTCPHTCFAIVSRYTMRTWFICIYSKANGMETCILAPQMTWGEDLPNTTMEGVHQRNLERHLSYGIMKRITTRVTLDTVNRHSRKMAMLLHN